MSVIALDQIEDASKSGDPNNSVLVGLDISSFGQRLDNRRR
jgi:hypothetical protein